MNQCNKVYVIICDGPRYDIPGKLRQQWLQKIIPSVHIIVTDEDHDDDDSKGWAEKTKQVLGFAPDKVFSSEDYGQTYAKYLGSKHISFDPSRSQVKISGTAIRKNPYQNWEHLHPIVRAHYVKRIALVGAESCGKSTLGNSLAGLFSSYIVPEYGRFYWDAKQ
jgi:NadR type nicotinamide-nucleotide adenylyltransferase